jgi:hypothetical protein
MRTCSLQLYIQCAADQNGQLEERGSGFVDDVIIVTHHFQQPGHIGQLELDISPQIFDIFWHPHVSPPGRFIKPIDASLIDPSPRPYVA